MRWMWIDRFVEFESGRRAVTYKHTTLSDPPVDEYLPGFPIFPSSLIIEGLAQTAGLLVGETSDFRNRVVLAKVSKAEFHQPALIGRRLKYVAEIDDVQPDGAICTCVATADDEPLADVQLVFAHLDDRFPEYLFRPYELLVMLRVFALYDVGKAADGSPLQVPAYMLEAEQAEFAS